MSNLKNKKFSYLGKITLTMKNKIELIKKIDENKCYKKSSITIFDKASQLTHGKYGSFFEHKVYHVSWVREYQ